MRCGISENADVASRLPSMTTAAVREMYHTPDVSLFFFAPPLFDVIFFVRTPKGALRKRAISSLCDGDGHREPLLPHGARAHSTCDEKSVLPRALTQPLERVAGREQSASEHASRARRDRTSGVACFRARLE